MYTSKWTTICGRVLSSINVIRLRSRYKNAYSSCRQFRIDEIHKSNCNSGIVNTRSPHSIFLGYLESIKENDISKIMQNLNKCVFANINIFEFNKNIWKGDLDTDDTISLILEQIKLIKLRLSFEDIDDLCCSIINQITPTDIIKYLIIFLIIYPSNIVDSNFYKQSIEILKTTLKRNGLNHQETMNLLFFAGLRKKSGAYDVKFIMKYMLPIKKLSLIGQSIVTNIMFKCSIKLTHVQANVIENSIEQNSVLLVKKLYLFVPMCKALRYRGPSGNFNMMNISEALIDTQNKLELTVIGHVLSLYAEARIKHIFVLKKLFNDAFNNIIENSVQVRLKDIDNLLWSARILNYPLCKNEVNVINTLIHRKFYYYKDNAALMINILLSLWILGYKSKQLIKKCFENHIFTPVIEDKCLAKPIARLNLLLFCIRIEAPEIQLPDQYDISNKCGLKTRKNIRIMLKKLDALKDNFGLSKLELNCPVENLYISGISAKYKSANIHIDLLDASTCLRNSNEPDGLMNLKIRLLPQLGYQSILVPEIEMENLEVLDNYLKKKLNLKL